MPETLYQSPMQTFVDLIKMLFAALVIVVIIRSFIIQPYVIPSESMLNTLQVGDRLFVTKFSYGIHLPFIEKEILSTGEPEIGDIIVFPYPENKSQDFIKRVVGLPGDVVEIRNKDLYRNGEKVDEPYVIHRETYANPRSDNMKPMTVPPGTVFVLGDNRDQSHDSRFWGVVDKESIHGKAWFIYWSSTEFVDVKWDRIGNMLR
ncbi:signal peptidase I [Desulfovibrio sp. OttesenSCG-928-G15]|nr:signal peptidase I [Desulfovibrio sp. OttesenSCG-928-G15]